MAPSQGSIRLRSHRLGDVGWLLERHADMYGREFGYHPAFEAYVAETIAPFLRAFDARRDRLWIAQVGGRRVGCIAIQHDRDRRGWAKLRWFLVEKDARGQGLGARLLRSAIAFSRKVGYKGILLWTVDDLHVARSLYENAGFQLVHQATAPCSWAPWGHEQRWEKRLARPPGRAT